MRTSEERVTELHRRMDHLRQAKVRRRTNLICASAIAACLAITMLLAAGISRISVQPGDTAPGGVTASIFAGHAALGYIVTALIALCLGSLVTVLCYRLKRRMREEERRHDREH